MFWPLVRNGLKGCFSRMAFKQLAVVLKNIESTSSTLIKTNILADFLREHPSERQTIEDLSHYIVGDVKLQIKEGTLVKVPAYSEASQETVQPTASNNPKQSVHLSNQQENSYKSISMQVTCENVISALKALQETSGKESIVKRISILSKLSGNMDHQERDFLKRIILGRLRIGLSRKLLAKSFNQSLSLLKSTNESNEIQTSRVSPSCNQSAIQSSLTRAELMLARPILTVSDFQSFCLGKKCAIVADIKYDGQRTCINFDQHNLTMTSRNGKSQLEKHSKLAQQLRQMLTSWKHVTQIQLDCQITPIDPKSQKPLPAQMLFLKKTTRPMELVVYCFDCLQLNGQSLASLELKKRRNILKNILNNHPLPTFFKLAQTRTFLFPQDEKDLKTYFKQTVASGYQGLILKGQTDPYMFTGSRTYWAKLKKGFSFQGNEQSSNIELDLVIMGASKGTGKLAGIYSKFLVGARKGDSFIAVSKVGSGLTEAQLSEMTAIIESKGLKMVPKEYKLSRTIKMDAYLDPKDSFVLEVRCQDLTKSPEYGQLGISMRFPTIKAIRHDKSAAQSNTAEQIIDLMERSSFQDQEDTSDHKL